MDLAFFYVRPDAFQSAEPLGHVQPASDAFQSAEPLGHIQPGSDGSSLACLDPDSAAGRTIVITEMWGSDSTLYDFSAARDIIDFDDRFGPRDVRVYEEDGHTIVGILYNGEQHQRIRLAGIRLDELDIGQFRNFAGPNMHLARMLGRAH